MSNTAEKITHPAQLNSSNSSLQSYLTSIKSISLSFLCGSLAGAANILSSHPFDTIKVRIQVLDMKFSHCIRYMLDHEGYKSFYKGITSPLFTVPLMDATLFGAYELGKRIQGIGIRDEMTNFQSAFAGSVAGLIVCGVMTPVELVKCRMQMEGTGRKAHTTKAFDLTKQIIKVNGIKELYKGNLITIIREVPAAAIYFLTYEDAKKRLNNYYGKSKFTPLLAGGLAGLLSWLFTYPQDVVKTKLQCDTGLVKKYPDRKVFGIIKDGGIISCTKSIWRNNGISGFTKGFSACSLKAVIAEAVTFFVYENAKGYVEH